MRVAILGFQTSGKTTIFNALTGQQLETSAYGGRVESHLAIVKVPDPRLDRLSALFKPKKTTPATVEFVDLAPLPRAEGGESQGLGEKQMTEIGVADALLAVLRGFSAPNGTAPDPESDAEAMNLEMAIADLRKVENRIERIDKKLHTAPTAERPALAAELDTLRVVGTALEQGRPARAAELNSEQVKQLRGFQLLTMKPTMFLINEDEERWEQLKGEPVTLPALKDLPATVAARLCGQMEMEIAQLAEEDRAAFLESYGIAEPAAHRVLRLCYQLLGKISFFTVGPDECRAWTIDHGATAPTAAGAIHSDLERGFIRAEVINWQELLDLGGLTEAKRKGKLRLEGKNYVVQDGDTMNILFSV